MAVLDEEENTGSGSKAKKLNQPQEAHVSTTFKILLTAWAFLENILFSGLRAGWPALVYILKQEHIYDYLCDIQNTGDCSEGSVNCAGNIQTNNTSFSHNQSASSNSYNLANGSTSNFSQWNKTTLATGCKAQDAVFNQCFTVATATMALSALLYGNLNYKFGIRVPRLVSVFFFVCGALCFAFTDKDVPWLIFPGLLLISSGGMALYITNNQISYMYSTGSAAVVGLLCGALEASSIVQTIIKIFYEHGISLRISYCILAALYSFTLISTFFCLPKDFISSKTEVTHKESATELDTELVNQHTLPVGRSSESIKLEKLGDTTGVIAVKHKTGTAKRNLDSDVDHLKMVHKDITELHSGAAKSQEVSQTATNDKYNITSERKNSQRNILTVNEQDLSVEKDKDNHKRDASLQAQTESSLQSEQQKHAHHEDEENSASYSVIQPKTERRSEHGRKERSSNEKTLLQCLLSKTFLLYLFWAVAVQIILSMCLGTFNPWLEYVTHNNTSKVSRFTDVLFYSMLGSPVLSLCIGLAMDALKRSNSSDQTEADTRTLHTATISLGVTSILGVLVCAFFMTCQEEVIIGTSIALVIFRTALYSCGTAFLRIMYPTNYFGVLCGIMSVLAGGLSFLQYPLFLWIQHRNDAYTEVFGFLGLIGLFSLTQPVYLHWKSWKFRRILLDQRNDTVSSRM